MGRDVNGVFKGGGAKGIAYAGAIAACEEAGLQFKEVAGSSAGAITATLVACGYSSTEIIDRMPEALRTVGNPFTAALKVFVRPSLLDSTRLLDWLRRAVFEKVCGAADEPVRDCTFQELLDATGISLYVVTLDLATNQPIVFCPKLTPESPVAPAVVASSAIPVAFPAARVEIDDRVHRIVDGGTWSNYPVFVFLDDEFRYSAGLAASARPTIGFILDEAGARPAAPSASPRIRAGRHLLSDRGSSAQQLKFVGALLSSTIVRWGVGLIPVLFTLLSVFWLHQELTGASGLVERMPTALHDLAIVLAVGVLAVTGLASAVFVFVMLRFGRSVFDSGIVGAKSAMGVGPGVAYWVGTTPPDDGHGSVRDPAAVRDHVAVRIPIDRLTTLKFHAPPQVRYEAILAGYEATGEVLARAFPATVAERSRRPVAPDPETWTLRRTLRAPLGWLLGAIAWVIRQLTKRAWLRAIALSYALAGGVVWSLLVVDSIASGQWWSAILWMLLVGTSVLVGVALVATMRMLEADLDRREPYKYLGHLRSPLALRVLAVVAGAFAVIVAVSASSDGGLSFYSATRAERVVGEVVDITPGDVTDVIDVVLTGDRQPDDDAYGAFLDIVFAAELDPGFTDLVGADVFAVGFSFDGEVTQLEDFDTSELTLELETTTAYAVGQPVEVGVDPEEELVFLLDDRDTSLESENELIGGVVLSVSLAMLSFRSRRAASWLEQRPADRGEPDQA